MSWYRAGTVAVTNGSAAVTLTGGDALQNISVDDGFIGPDGKTYPIQSIGGAGSFTLAYNYTGSTASGQSYVIIPVAMYAQLRTMLEEVNDLITAYQTIAINAGVGKFAVGSAAAPGVRGSGHEGTGLVWNGDESLSISVNGTIVATFTDDGINNWSIPLITAPAATDRIPVSTSSTDSGYSLRGEFVWKGAGVFKADAPIQITATSGNAILNLIEAGVRNWGLRSGALATNVFDIADLTGGASRFSINQNGHVGIGGVNASTRLHVKSSAEIARFETTTARGSGGGFVSFYDPTGSKGYFGYGGANDKLEIVNSLNADILFYTNNVARWQILAAGALAPVTDNTVNLGVAATGRIKDTYLVNSPTVTSDEREKTWHGDMSDAEYGAALQIIKELGFYQWNESVQAKGADARYHFGPRAQRVGKIMSDHGLDPHRYGFFCYDKWEEQTEDVMQDVTIKAVYKGKGKNRVEVEPERTERVPTGETRVTVEAGDRYGVRPDQLVMFLMSAQDRRLSAIEERMRDGK